jgi:UDP-glucose 4-epimerase
MKIIITGACGHIGSYFVHNLHKIKKIRHAILIDNLETQRYTSLFNLKDKKKISFFQIDLTKKNSLKNFKNIDLIIHCASLTNAAGSFSTKKIMYKNNLACMKNIINFCVKKKTKLIHISTTSIYGKEADLINESDNYLIKPQSPYAEIKLIEEKMLKRVNKKIKYNTFRFGTITGISRGMRFHTAVNKFCFEAALNKKITIYKTALNQYRPYLSLRDSFKIFKFCIEKNFFKNETYNALSGNYSVKEIVKSIKKFKKNAKITFISSPIMNRLNFKVSRKKLKTEGLSLDSNIDIDIKNSLNLFKNIKNEM